ncbi:murein DD-endopeptidase MepM/ murein hydrolase activator NlpD [Agromyces sp. 3263]|uniref:M23 family metallopeptidase n=1 Tax=Agromyces sp. 3263 TaxID=2817750 RepID=UPI0028646AD3|nr:M23 family metallopeptidase [Agromyces sp. 3263]MDR6907910.1 murein DD-endopeptidase MepM/ murein hydrolase activator NlpD [Agromyces sp. 3263]
MNSPTHGRRAAPKPPASSRARAFGAGPRAARTSPDRTARSRSLRPAFSVIAMTFASGMLVATSVPALAITATDAEPRASVYAPVEDSITLAPQAIEVAHEAELKPMAVEGYAVEAAPPPLLSQVAGLGSVSIIKADLVVWPVLTPQKRSDGFGPRNAPCAGCSTSHDGVDFNPGNGSPVMSIADGVVVLATENGGGLGVNVEVQHNIDGELVTSSYAHMQFGSLQVVEGQRVSAGQQLGAVGTTGQSTGPHMHLEMFGADGVRFDGFAWLDDHIA